MLTFLTVLLFFTALLLLAVVYLQDSEGGLGESSSAISGAYGVRTVNKFLERTTGLLFALLIILVIGINLLDIREKKSSALDRVPVAAPAPKVPEVPAVR